MPGKQFQKANFRYCAILVEFDRPNSSIPKNMRAKCILKIWGAFHCKQRRKGRIHISVWYRKSKHHRAEVERAVEGL